jgi:hypothetical protein
VRGNSCFNRQTGEFSPLDVVLKFDASGKLVKSFGAGMFAFRTASTSIATAISG